ncbi:quinol dehydrogenase ferredoxin subunit NapH [bacterium]|nr:MAG: quinol dehydrogenase ferredoxin subunit NapH [bacterium]
MKRYKYQIARRFIQVSIFLLFFGGNAFGWDVLKGNLSSAEVLNLIPLTDPFAVLQIFSTGALVAKDALIGASIILLFYAVLGGRVFCGWVCPVNIVTDAANKFRDTLKFNEKLLSWGMKRSFRYWVIGLSLIVSAILGVAAFEWISPIGALHRGIIYGLGIGWTYVLIVFLFDLFAVRNGFCGHACPLGAFYALVGRYGFLRVGYNMDKCNMCMKCLNICPERQVLHTVGRESGKVRSGECTNCGRCIEVCDENALLYSNIYSKKTL